MASYDLPDRMQNGSTKDARASIVAAIRSMLGLLNPTLSIIDASYERLPKFHAIAALLDTLQTTAERLLAKERNISKLSGDEQRFLQGLIDASYDSVDKTWELLDKNTSILGIFAERTLANKLYPIENALKVHLISLSKTVESLNSIPARPNPDERRSSPKSRTATFQEPQYAHQPENDRFGVPYPDSPNPYGFENDYSGVPGPQSFSSPPPEELHYDQRWPTSIASVAAVPAYHSQEYTPYIPSSNTPPSNQYSTRPIQPPRGYTTPSRLPTHQPLQETRYTPGESSHGIQFEADRPEQTSFKPYFDDYQTPPPSHLHHSQSEPQFNHTNSLTHVSSFAHSKTIRRSAKKIITYRVEKLPLDVTPDTVQAHFEVDSKTHLKVRSLVPVLGRNGVMTQTATMEYLGPDGVGEPEPLGRHLSVSRHFHGFTPLSNPSGPVTADIIAITGLAGHAFGSWAVSSHTMWLRDFLPQDFPQARVLTYGYDSQLRGSTSRSIITDHSDAFKQKLQLWRKDCPERPVIFIGHSLGCLIIKKVVWELSGIPTPGINPLPVSMIIFMGAPHRGLEQKALEKLTSESPTEALIRELAPDSGTIRELNTEFKRVGQHVPIITCYETKETKTAVEGPGGEWKRDGRPVLMVPPGSAKLEWDNEKCIVSDTDHSQIAKLSDTSDSIYEDLSSEISRVINAPPVTPITIPAPAHVQPARTRTPEIEPDPSTPKHHRPPVQTEEPPRSKSMPKGMEAKLRKAVEASKESKGANHSETLAKTHKLAAWLKEQGEENQLVEAERICRQVLDVRKWKIGPSAVETLASLDLLGNILQQQGKIDDAEHYYRDIMDQREKVQGPEDEATLLSMYRVADILYQQSKNEEAESLLRSLLSRRIKVSGSANVKTVEVQSLLAKVLGGQEKYPEAREILEKILEMNENYHGSESYQALYAVHDLGVLCGRLEQYPEAEELLTRAWKGREELDQDDTYFVGQSLDALAEIYYLQGKYEEAAHTYRKILEVTEVDEVVDKPAKCQTMFNLAEALFEGDTEFGEAERILREALEFKKDLDPDDTLLYEIPICLGRVLSKLGKTAAAEIFVKQALVEAEKTEEHETIGSVLEAHASMMQERGDLSQAVEIYLEAIKELEYPEVDKDNCFDAMEKLGEVYEEMGNWSGADSTFTKLLHLQESEYGENDPRTISTIEDLLGVLESSGAGKSRRANKLRASKEAREVAVAAAAEAEPASPVFGYHPKEMMPKRAIGGAASIMSSRSRKKGGADKGKKENKKAEAKSKTQAYSKSATAKDLAQTFEDSDDDDDELDSDPGLSDGYESDPGPPPMTASLSGPLDFADMPFSPFSYAESNNPTPPPPPSKPEESLGLDSLYAEPYTPQPMSRKPAPLASPRATPSSKTIWTRECTLDTFRNLTQVFEDCIYSLESIGIRFTINQLTPEHRQFLCEFGYAKFVADVEVPKRHKAALKFSRTAGNDDQYLDLAVEFELRVQARWQRKCMAVKFDRKHLKPSGIWDIIVKLLENGERQVKIGVREGPWIKSEAHCEFMRGKGYGDGQGSVSFDVRMQILLNEAFIEVSFECVSGDKFALGTQADIILAKLETAAFNPPRPKSPPKPPPHKLAPIEREYDALFVKFDRKHLRPSEIWSVLVKMLRDDQPHSLEIGDRTGSWVAAATTCTWMTQYGHVRFTVKMDIQTDEAFIKILMRRLEGNISSTEKLIERILGKIEANAFHLSGGMFAEKAYTDFY